MSKTFKRFFAGLLAFVMVFALTAAAAPAKEVKADEEKYEMFLAIGAAEDWSMCYDNAPDYAGDIQATNATVGVGETATISLVMPREVDKTWYLAPVLLAEGVQDLDYTISSITLDGAEILDTVNLNAREAGDWWYEGTGVYTDKQAIRLAGGYNEWGDKFMAEGPTGWTEISYTITLNSIEFAPEYEMFVAIGAAEDWSMCYDNAPDYAGDIIPTKAMVSEGETVTIGLVMPREVDKTWYVAPVLVAEGVETLDFTVNSITLDGEEILPNVNLDVRADGPWWYEGTGVFTDKQAIRLAGGYNEWGDKFMAEGPTGWTELYYTITINNIETAPEYETFLAIGAAEDWSMCFDNAPDYAGDIIANVEKVSAGKTVTLSLVMPREVDKTWYLAPVLVADGVQTLDYTVNSITIDGEEVLDSVNLNAREAGNWWYEATGPYTDTQAIRLAGGYNEWGDKFMAESPVGWTELTYTYTLNSIGTEAAAAKGGAMIGGTPYEGDMTVFLAMQGDVTSGAWDMTWVNGSTDVEGVEATFVTNAKSGDTVTIGLKFPQELVYTWWMAPVVMLNNAPEDLVTTLDYTIDKITIDGEEVTPDLTLGSKEFWYEGTGDYTDTQAIRLKGGYNEWGDHYIESPVNYTEIMYTITLGDVYTGQVEGELYTGEATMFLAGTAESAADAWDWTWANGSTDNAAITGTVATVKSGDTVTLSLTYPSPVHHTWWMAPTLVLPEAADGVDLYNVMYTIDKVAIDGVDVTDKVTLNKAAALAWYEGTEDHPVTRTLRLGGGYNEWGADNAKCMDGTLLEGFTTIEYTITLDAIYAEPKEEAPQLKADLDGTYNAYVGIQSGAYTFRNAWDDASYGRDTNPDVFAQMSLIESDGTVTKKAGTFVDAVIAGNGTYTLEINDLAWDDGSEALNLLYISTDIPKSGEIVFSNLKVDFDGKNVMEMDEAFLDGDSKEVMKALFINIWNKDITNTYNMAGMLPKSNVKITFDVSGFNYDKAAEVTPEPTPEPTEAPAAPTEAPAEPTEAPAAPTEAPAEPTEAPAAPTEAPADVDADTEGGMSPLVIVIIVVAVIAVAGVAAFVVMKKKK